MNIIKYYDSEKRIVYNFTEEEFLIFKNKFNFFEILDIINKHPNIRFELMCDLIKRNNNKNLIQTIKQNFYYNIFIDELNESNYTDVKEDFVIYYEPSLVNQFFGNYNNLIKSIEKNSNNYTDKSKILNKYLKILHSCNDENIKKKIEENIAKLAVLKYDSTKKNQEKKKLNLLKFKIK